MFVVVSLAVDYNNIVKVITFCHVCYLHSVTCVTFLHAHSIQSCWPRRNLAQYSEQAEASNKATL